MLSIGDLRTPELAGEIASPNTTLGPECIDNRTTGIVHVSARERLATAGWNERELCMSARQSGQRTHVVQHGLEHGPGFQVEAMIDDY